MFLLQNPEQTFKAKWLFFNHNIGEKNTLVPNNVSKNINAPLSASKLWPHLCYCIFDKENQTQNISEESLEARKRMNDDLAYPYEVKYYFLNVFPILYYILYCMLY